MDTSKRQPANKGRRYPIEALSDDELIRLDQSVSGDSSTNLQRRALLAVLCRSCLRCSEALALYPRDVDYVRHALHVHMGKGGKSRVVGLPADAWLPLALWMERRRSLGVGVHSPIFCTIRGKQGKPLATANVRRMFAWLGKLAGIERRVHPHGLRHTGARLLVRAGVPLPQIQAQLGHTSLATTSRYVCELEPDGLLKTIGSLPSVLPIPAESIEVAAGVG